MNEDNEPDPDHVPRYEWVGPTFWPPRRTLAETRNWGRGDVDFNFPRFANARLDASTSPTPHNSSFDCTILFLFTILLLAPDSSLLPAWAV